MKTCIYCKTSLSIYGEDKYCRECGNLAVESPKCPVCGTSLLASDKFCGTCGWDLSKDPENPVYPEDDEDAMTDEEYNRQEADSHVH